jgi:NAD(P)-dependent dehydrogenase (short-subunit alcohol dehydrogenase family)
MHAAEPGQLTGKVAVITGATAGIGLAIAKRFVTEGVGLTFRGAYFTVQRALPLLNDGATIVLVSSIAGRGGTARHGIYNASKAAVRSLARTLTVELRDRGMRVNALSPGPTDTQGFARFAGERAADFRQHLAEVIPVGRIGRPEEVASAALFLASAESSFIAGIELVVDGGMSQT